MTEKDNGKYHYEPYTQLSKAPIGGAGGPMMGGATTLRREFQGVSKMSPSDSRSGGGGNNGGVGGGIDSCCACNSAQNGPFWVGLLTNLGICALLFAYTLLGKSITLAHYLACHLLFASAYFMFLSF